jgi:hypothetical protein
METFLTDIVEGRAPMQRQGILGVQQQVVNAVGAPAFYALAGAAALVVVYLVWLFVIRDLCGLSPERAKPESAQAQDRLDSSTDSSQETTTRETAGGESPTEDGLRRRAAQ